VIATLAVEITGGQTTKFIVDEWDQLGFSVPVSLPEANQQIRNLTTLGLHVISPTVAKTNRRYSYLKYPIPDIKNSIF
jgi:hypothetical protein